MASRSTPLSSDPRVNPLLAGQHWGLSVGESIALSYSIPQGSAFWVANYAGNEPSAWSALSAAETSAFQQALNTWGEVANIDLTQVADAETYGDIRVAFSQLVSDDPTAAAWAYIPGDPEESGDIWLDRTSGGSYQAGSFGYATFLHEIGHALGLGHPFETKVANNSLLTGDENSTQYSVMSNEDFEGAGFTFTPTGPNSYSWHPVQVTTPMLYDILAIQYLYGANTSTRTGDDTYTFSNSSAELQAIWDAGGSDTFDLSNQNLALQVNLNAGQFSSIGIKETWQDGQGIVVSAASDNVAIAYDVIIENVIGGSGDDVLTGNQAGNQLSGGPGSDTLIGGQGIDTAIYTENFASYALSTNQSLQILVNELSSGDSDTLSEIEWLQFKDQTIAAAVFNGNVPQNPDEVILNPNEGSENHINYFLLSLPEALATEASVEYRTLDGTALAGLDYKATSGLAVIAAGQTSAVIAVEIIADTIAEADETFFLEVSNPIGANFPEGEIILTAMRTIINDDFV
ncbi:hypothetical protein A9Q90_01445 [Gammaproteobacteria bacterium 54_18_T64]|nr:hypothetical protein A9Q90_01445 [Gammaproteobacteria bacterium 54_18_T64]